MNLEELKELREASDEEKLQAAKDNGAEGFSLEQINEWLDEAIGVEEEREATAVYDE